MISVLKKTSIKSGRFVQAFLILGLSAGLVAQEATQSKPSGKSTLGSMNPDVSVNFLTLYQAAKQAGINKLEPNRGFSVQEAELQFLSDVDPYLRASALLSIHPSHDIHDHSHGTEPIEKHYEIEPEEVFFETISLPVVTMKAGRFHVAVGRHNTLHTHNFPFIDAPLINQELLGDEGLIETGVSAAALIPNLPWFSELTAQTFKGESTSLFGNQACATFPKAFKLRNFVEMHDTMTFDLGLSSVSGLNFYNHQTQVQGADFTFKWRPSQGGKYTSFILGSEYLQGDVKGRTSNEKLSGLAYWAQYQFAERWWLQARNEWAKSKDPGSKKAQKQSVLVGFFPSEFSGFRFQYDHVGATATQDTLHVVSLQANMTIGAHPAHSY